MKKLPDLFVQVCGIGQVELPSFAIGLLKNIVTTATGVETVKIKGFSVGFIVVRFFR